MTDKTVMNSSILYVISALSFLLLAMRRSKLAGDSSLMTYRGHSVLYTLIRCYFSPMHTTGQVGDCRSMINCCLLLSAIILKYFSFSYSH